MQHKSGNKMFLAVLLSVIILLVALTFSNIRKNYILACMRAKEVQFSFQSKLEPNDNNFISCKVISSAV